MILLLLNKFRYHRTIGTTQRYFNYNPQMFRKDACGAWIMWDKFGDQDSIYGWEIDHIVPRSHLEHMHIPEDKINHPWNLRALQWQNNRSKGDYYPSYMSKVTAERNNNTYRSQAMTINSKIQEKLKQLYTL